MSSHKERYIDLSGRVGREPTDEELLEEHFVGTCGMEACESCQEFYADQNLDWSINARLGKS